MIEEQTEWYKNGKISVENNKFQSVVRDLDDYGRVYQDPWVAVLKEAEETIKHDGKDTNPKDAIGSNKLPLGLCPDTMEIFAALAFLEGAAKYGRYNWRIAGVRASIYYDAVGRHLDKWWNGEWADPKTKVPHLASALASIAIILDAHVCDKLNDDRPPRAPDLSALIDSMSEGVKHLKELFKDHHPKQWTIEDTKLETEK